MRPVYVRCGNPACGHRLHESPSLPRRARKPCPHCGSLARAFDLSLTARVQSSASLARTKISETIERSRGWYLVLVALIFAGALVGLVRSLGPVWGTLLSVAIGLLALVLGPRAERRIRRETEYVDDD